MKVDRNIVDNLMNYQSEIDNEMVGDYRWDDINSFSFDAEGYLQWFSPSSDGERVASCKDMMSKMERRGFAVYDRDGYISL